MTDQVTDLRAFPCPSKTCRHRTCSHTLIVEPDNPFEDESGECWVSAFCYDLLPPEEFKICAETYERYEAKKIKESTNLAVHDSISKPATMEDLQKATEEVKRTVRKAKREIIEDAHTARASEADNRRVPTGERSDQIAAVRKLVHEARANGKKMSILRACRAVWRDVNGGYPSPEALYDYCHSHKTEF